MKKSATESAATDSPHGTDSSTESSATASTEPIETTPRKALFGVAKNVIPIATPAHRSPPSDDERKRLFRIARDRGNRFMVSAVDVDFLLDVIVEAKSMSIVVGSIYIHDGDWKTQIKCAHCRESLGDAAFGIKIQPTSWERRDGENIYEKIPVTRLVDVTYIHMHCEKLLHEAEEATVRP